MLMPNRNFDELSLGDNNNCIITGGHFRIFFENNVQALIINTGTVISFESAVKFYLEAVSKKIKADLGILINDMGSSCDENGCQLETVQFSRKCYQLPQELDEILSANGLKDYLVKIYWEKHIRNRGKKEFLKLLKRGKLFGSNPDKGLIPEIIREKDFIYLNDPEGYGKIILTRISQQDKYGTPVCPLIMSGFNIEQSKLYNYSINFYYIGADNISNIPNYHSIEKGKRICELLGCNMSIKNIYFDKY